MAPNLHCPQDRHVRFVHPHPISSVVVTEIGVGHAGGLTM